MLRSSKPEDNIDDSSFYRSDGKTDSFMFGPWVIDIVLKEIPLDHLLSVFTLEYV